MFALTIDTVNDAFGEWPRTEVAQILRSLADQFDRTDTEWDGHGIVKDHNGNTVGNWTLRHTS